MKNDMVLKQWKSRAAGTMCCFNCWARRGEGPLRAEHSSSFLFFFHIDRWMLPLTIHLALVKHSQRQIGEGRSEWSRFRASEPAAPIPSSPFFFILFSSPSDSIFLYPPVLLREYTCGCSSELVDVKICGLFFNFPPNLTNLKGNL